MFIFKFYKYIFYNFYRWFYNPEALVNSAADNAWLAITPLTWFNVLSVWQAINIFLLHQSGLQGVIWCLSLFVIIGLIYHIAFLSGKKYKNIDINRNLKTKLRDNIFQVL